MKDKIRTHLYQYGFIDEFEFKNYTIENVTNRVMSDNEGFYFQTMDITDGHSVRLRRINLDFIVDDLYYLESNINFRKKIYFGLDDKNCKIYFYPVKTKPQREDDYLVRH